MAQKTQAIVQVWEDLKKHPVSVPDNLWRQWALFVSSPVDGILERLSSEKGDVDCVCLDAINTQIIGIIEFIKSIKKSSHGGCFIDEHGTIFLDTRVRNLIAHHMGNDLYKVTLILDDYLDGPCILDASETQSLIDIFQDIVGFQSDLKGCV